MKKLLNVFAIVLIGLLVLVSCSPETSNVEDKLAVISLRASERDTRSLTKTNPVLDAEEFWWSYTAKKTDETQLITGQTGADGTTVTALSNKGLTGAVGAFSYGEWAFTLYGYADENRTQLAYQGSSPVVITGSTTTIAVTVQSQTAGNGSGYLQIPAKGTITLKRTDAAETAVTDYSKFIERINIEPVTEIAEQDVVTVYDQTNDTDKDVRTFSLKSGSYSVTISYLQSATLSEDKKTCTGGYVVAEETIVVTIADYLTTKIGGDISENTSQVTFIAQGEITKVVANAALKADAVKLDVEIPATPAVASREDSDTAAEVKKTTVSVPKGLVSGNVSNAKLSVTSYTQEAVSETKPTIEIKDSGSTTSTTAVVVGGLDIDLYVNNSTEKTTEFANDQVLTITTYIAPELNGGNDYTYSTEHPTCGITVKYNGEGKADGTVQKYVSSTGELTFTVDHLSSFYIAVNPVARNTITGAVYATLYDAVMDAPSCSTVTLLCDSKGSGLESKDGDKARESLTIDFSKHTYTVDRNPVGSVGWETQAMHWGTSLGSITLKNGTFKVAGNVKGLKMAMQNYIEFTASGMSFDFSKIAVDYYTEDKYKAYADYYQKERPTWGNNKNGTVLLESCNVTINGNSSKGICEGGKGTTLKDTTINGYVCVDDANQSVTTSGTTSITKGVISYLARNKIVTTTTDNSTVYTSVAYEAKIGDVYYDTFAEALTAAGENSTIILQNDITLNKDTWIGKSITIDINEKTINLAAGSSLHMSDTNLKSDRIEFKNGKIVANTSGSSNAAIVVEKGTTVIFDDVEVTDITNTAKYYFIWISDYGDNAKQASLEIKNSKFTNLNVIQGIYVGGLVTNSDEEISVTIDNSTFTVNNTDNTSAYKNISAGIIAASPTNLTVTGNSTISGQAQAITLKSGKAEIKDSTIAITYNGTWTNDTGAALQLTESFTGTVELSNVKLGTANAEHYGIHIATGGTPTITGTLTSDSVTTITKDSSHTITKNTDSTYTIAKDATV